MYLHTPVVEAGSWWRTDTASGSDTPTTVYAYDGTGPIGNWFVLTGSTVRNTSRDGTARFWSAAATLYLKELTYQGVPTGTVVTSVGSTPATPVGGAPVDIATISATVAALPTTYVQAFPVAAPSGDTTGVTDTARISAVISAALALGAGEVALQPGTYWATLPARTGITVRGAGEGATTVKLPAGANTDLVSVPNFSTLTGTNSTGGQSQFCFRDLTLDGNGSNQTATSWTFRVYGSNYRMFNVTIQNGRDGNVFSEWSTSSAGNMESFWENFKIRTPTGTGAVNLDWQGPHDSHFVSGEVVAGTSNLAQYGVWSRGNSGADVFMAVHVWGFHAVGWTQEHSCLATACEAEGALTNLSVLSSQVRWQGWLFGTSGSRNNEIGLSLGQGVSGCDLDVQMFAFSNAASGKPFVYAGTGSGGKNRIVGVVNGFGANAITSGTTNATDYVALFNADSTQNGAMNWPSPPVIQVNSGNALIIRKPVANGVRFNWDTTSSPERAQVMQGARSGWYTDQGSTEVARIDAADGSIRPGTTAGLGGAIFSGTGAPTIAGTQGDWYLQKDQPVHWYCSVTGAAGSATWVVHPRTQPSSLTSGEETLDRLLPVGSGGSLGASGRLNLTYFTARKSGTLTQVRVNAGNTAAGATPTLCRIGLYSIASNGNGTLAASTPNDTALFASTFTAYTKSFSVSVAVVAGQRYALSPLVISGAALPTIYGYTTNLGAELAVAPRVAGYFGGQTDLPGSFTDADLTASSTVLYAAVLP